MEVKLYAVNQDTGEQTFERGANTLDMFEDDEERFWVENELRGSGRAWRRRGRATVLLATGENMTTIACPKCAYEFDSDLILTMVNEELIRMTRIPTDRATLLAEIDRVLQTFPGNHGYSILRLAREWIATAATAHIRLVDTHRETLSLQSVEKALSDNPAETYVAELRIPNPTLEQQIEACELASKFSMALRSDLSAQNQRDIFSAAADTLRAVKASPEIRAILEP